MPWRRPLFAPVDAALVAVLVLFAALIRTPYLQSVPRLTDETDNVRYALDIHRGGARPLVSVDHYNGPMFDYLLAAGFAAGAGARWPRRLALALGALAAGATYLLGASLSAIHRRTADPSADPSADAGPDRLAGALAAAFMATSFVPVAINSHIAWSNSTTPFWTAAFLFAAAEAVRRDRPAWLLAAGTLGGLALQSHPSALAALVGAAAWVAAARPAWLRTRWPALAALAAGAAMANVIVFNVQSGGGSIAMAQQRDYAFSTANVLSGYPSHLAGMLRLAYQTLGSTFQIALNETADPAALRAALGKPGAVVAVATAVTAVVATARRAGLPACAWLAALAILPLFNQAWYHYIHARYLALLLPPTYAAVGIALAAGMRRPGAGAAAAIRRRADGGPPPQRDAVPSPTTRTAAFTRMLSVALAVALIAHPLRFLQRTYAAETAMAKDNVRLWQVGDALAPLGRADRPVLLDGELRRQRTTAGGTVLKALDALLAVAGTPHERVSKEDIVDEAADGSVIVLSDGLRDEIAAESASVVAFAPLDIGAPLAPAAPGDYAVYRLTRAASR